MTKHDKVLLVIILAFSCLSYIMFFAINEKQTSLTAQISVNGKTVSKIPLSSSTPCRLINVSGPLGTSLAEVRPGAIRMKSSPCPDHCCMETGWIDQPGAVIVCVPNRIVIEIIPDKNSVDAITR